MNTKTHRILTALSHADEPGLTGLDIQNKTRLGVGTTYPHLLRLETSGFITRTQETTQSGTPRRIFYRATDLGRAVARQAQLLPAPTRTPRWTPPAWARALLHRTGASTIDDATSPPDAFATSWPHPVLVRNCLLGGAMPRPLDRHEAARLRALDPDVDGRATAVEADRGRILGALVDRGLAEQVLDLTTGVPARGIVRSAHVALAETDPHVPVVYVVTDDLLAVATKDLTRYRSHVGVLVANPCDTHTVWDAVTRVDSLRPGRLIHPGRPVLLDALTISDLVPDPRRLRSVLRAWRNTVRPGSLLLVARSLDPALPDPLPIARQAGWHLSSGITPPAEGIEQASDYLTRVKVFTTTARRWPRRSMRLNDPPPPHSNHI